VGGGGRKYSPPPSPSLPITGYSKVHVLIYCVNSGGKQDIWLSCFCHNVKWFNGSDGLKMQLQMKWGQPAEEKKTAFPCKEEHQNIF
jgi:hypothetical protein